MHRNLHRRTSTALLSVTLTLLLASTAQASTQVTLAGYTDPAVVSLEGDSSDSDLTIQRMSATLVSIQDAAGVVRNEGDPTTQTYCTIVTPQEVTCTVPSGAQIGTGGSNLGGGKDKITVVPAITGPEVTLEVDGGAGDDTLTGGPGADALMGGDGNDEMLGMGGADFFSDAGTDPAEINSVIYADGAHTGAVNVTIDDGMANDGQEGVDGPGPTSLDTISVGINRIVGSDFNDVIIGSPGKDILLGGLGSDAIFGMGGDDFLMTVDSGADATLNCGDGHDKAWIDETGDSVEQCEDVTAYRNGDLSQPVVAPAPGGGPTPPAPSPLLVPRIGSTLVTLALPDITKGIYRGMSLDAIEAELGKTIPVAIIAEPLNYAKAASRAGKAKVRPYDVISTDPKAGARISGSIGRRAFVKAAYWDPTKDLVSRTKCDPKLRIRGKGGKGPTTPLHSALKGLEFREGKPGDEGEAQDLMRRLGCQYDAKVTFSLKATRSTVTSAKPATLTRKKRASGRVETTTVKGLRLQVTVPRTNNDFLVAFSESLKPPARSLPLRSDGKLATGQTNRLLIATRERSTGRVAEGTLAELVGPGGVTIAAAKSGSDGIVELNAYVAAGGEHKLYLSRDRTDPVSKQVVHQEGLVILDAVTPGAKWLGVGGTSYAKKGSGYTATSASGATAAQAASGPAKHPMALMLEIAKAASAGALADAVARSAGLTPVQRDSLAALYLKMLGVPHDSPAAALAGVRSVGLRPGLATTAAGRLCANFSPPSVSTVNAIAFRGETAVGGKAIGAKFGCGAGVTLDPASGLILPTGGTALGSQLIANDGSGLISEHGAGIISNDGGGLIANDGSGLIANDGSGLIANDGSSLVPLTPLLANDGAGIISNDGGGIISNDGGGLQPIGGGVSFQPAGR